MDREELANLCHDQWSGWMKYLFSKCVTTGQNVTIPDYYFDRRYQQMNTTYSDLSEREKEPDRIEADKFIELLK